MTVEWWLVDPDTDETILMIEEPERRVCPADRVALDENGECPECGLNWTIFS